MLTSVGDCIKMRQLRIYRKVCGVTLEASFSIRISMRHRLGFGQVPLRLNLIGP
jgi:hypothetical protein